MSRANPRDTTAAAAAHHDADAQRTPTAILRPILIRSLSRQRALADDKVLVQVVTPPTTISTPARGRLRRVVEVAPRPVAVEAAAQAQVEFEMEMEQIARQKKTVKEAVMTSTKAFLSPIAEQQPVRQSQDLVARMKIVAGSDSEHIEHIDNANRAVVQGSIRSATTPLKMKHSTSSMVPEKDDVLRNCCRCRWIEKMFTKYADALETRPLIFKCTTSAVVGGIGDVVAQALSWAFRGDVTRAVFWHDTKAMRQTLAVAIDGFFVNAPFLHFSYAVLDWWLPAQESTAFALAQVLVDIFILSPMYALSFIVTTGLLEGKSMNKEILPTVRDDYAILVFWLVVVGLILAPLHIFLFNRFSLKWRVLISDGIDLLWTVIACFVIEPE